MDDGWVGTLTPSQKDDLVKRLLLELREARDRLNQSPSNSSKPPSSRAPWDSPSRGDKADEPPIATSTPGSGSLQATQDGRDDGGVESDGASPSEDGAPSASTKKPSGKKAGKQIGAQGYGRTQKLAYTGSRDHFAQHCAGCGSCLPRDSARAYGGWCEIDVAAKVAGQNGLFLDVILHRIYAHTCACGHVTRAEHFDAPPDPLWDKVELGEWRLVGARLAGVIVLLALRMRLSRARVRELLNELFGVELSTGVIDETIREAGRAVAPLEDEMVRDIEEAALLHADETPWKEAAQALWLWVFLSTYTTLFFVGPRIMEIFTNLLSDKFTGDLMTDGYRVYRHHGKRLRCWAHLVRKLQGLSESTDARVAEAGASMLAIMRTLMTAIYEARSNPDLKPGALASQYAVEIALLKTLCDEHRGGSHGKLRSVAVEFLLDWTVILRQVSEPHLPLTNNASEQALRHWVIARRISYGTRNAVGSRAFAMLASVIETCRKRSASPWMFIAEVVAAARKGIPLPSLPSVPVGT
jgi:hypothetical protein